MSIYDDKDPKPLKGIRFTATEAIGFTSGRRRWKVECVTCGALVHEATTGPNSLAATHQLYHCSKR